MDFTSYANSAVNIAEDLVNTQNIVRGDEKMPNVAALARFLETHGITPPARLTGRDLAAVRALRPLLRPVYAAVDEQDAVTRLNELLARCGAVPQLVRHDARPWHLHVAPPGAPVDRQLGANAAMGLLAVIATGDFGRLHVCAGVRCAEVFVDISRNRSRRYCSPAICGNRAHAASHRRRRREREAVG